MKNKQFFVNEISLLYSNTSDTYYWFKIIGFHCFPDKDKARSETHRVLKKGGKLVACFYIRGEDKRTNWLVDKILSKKWFIPPYDTEESLKKRLSKMYDIENLSHEGSVVYFTAIKK